ncbi:HAD-IB family phosphatase [Candidatus Woesearchaeota archaeon]|nr:HAD-IB family phosphatase [Candidatus Woesearchaeota archaeon]
MNLVVFDMDGVLFQHFNFWVELHKVFGTWEEGKKLTQQYLHTDYPKLVQEVIGRLWAGKPAEAYYDLINSQTYVAGAKEVFAELRKRNLVTAIITSGSYDLAVRAQKELGVDYIFANKLLVENGRIVGTTDMSLWPIRSDEKVLPLQQLCQQLKISSSEVIAVIHDYNDIKLARHVREGGGRVIGFMYEPHAGVEKNCSLVVREKDLRTILRHLT